MIQLGLRPEPLRVHLVAGSTLRTEVKLEDPEATYDETAPILEFEDGTEWPADLSDDDTVASWTKTSSQVDALIASLGLKRNVNLTYDGSIWASGRVEIH